MQNVQEKHFFKRLELSDEITEKAVNALIDQGYISEAEKTPEEIDKTQAIDFWFDKKPVQFKVRCNGRTDMELCMYQPFVMADPDHVKGRDWLGLLNNTCVNHYFAFMDRDTQAIRQIIRVPSANLLPILSDLQSQWEITITKRSGKFATYNYNFFTRDIVVKWKSLVANERLLRTENGHEIWWKKNPNESFGKILAFLSPRVLDFKEVLIQKN